MPGVGARTTVRVRSAGRKRQGFSCNEKYRGVQQQGRGRKVDPVPADCRFFLLGRLHDRRPLRAGAARRPGCAKLQRNRAARLGPGPRSRSTAIERRRSARAPARRRPAVAVGLSAGPRAGRHRAAQDSPGQTLDPGLRRGDGAARRRSPGSAHRGRDDRQAQAAARRGVRHRALRPAREHRPAQPYTHGPLSRPRTIF